MYKWTLIISLLISSIAFGDIITPISGGTGGADTDSIKGVPVQDTTGNLSDNDVMRYDVGSDTWLYEAPPGASGGEANTLSDTGTFNGTSGFGLAGGKTGVALKVKGIIEGANITITADGDSAYSIASTGTGIWSEGTDSLFAVDSDGDTMAVFWDDDAGNVRWQVATSAQSLRLLIDSLGIGGDLISELAGNGLTVTSNELTADLGTSIVTGEIEDGTILEPDLNETSGSGSDNDVLTLNTGGTNFTWVTELLDANIPDSMTITLEDGSVTSAKLESNYRDSLGNLEQTETILANWVNTANPWADNEVADNITASNYLPLSGGTMGGDINDNDNAILNVRFLSVDTLVVDHDTSYADHSIAYLVRLDVHNASGATLDEDTPVYISGATGDTPNIDSARADNAAMMPAIGIVEHDIANGDAGHIIVFGQYGPFNTSAWSVQDPLYVGATGGLTNTKPTGTNLIQRIGTVTRNNLSQGDIQIVGAGRTNDLPNIASANFWLGNGSGVPTAVVMSSDATMDNAGAVTVANDSHDHTTTTISALDSTDVTANGFSFPSNLAAFTSAELAGLVSNETGTGVVVFGTTPTFTTSIIMGGSTVDATEWGYLDGVTSDIQTQFSGKQATVTDGDALTFTGATLDFDGGATPSGDLGGTWGTPSVNDDSHNHIYSNIDQTTSANWINQVSDPTGTGSWVFSIAPSFTLVPLFDSAQFDGNVDIDSLDVNGVSDFTGTITVGTVAGAIDMGAATSLEVPNGDNPTVNADGEMAWENDDNLFRTWDGSANRAIGTVRSKDFEIILPDSVNAYAPLVKFITIDVLEAPFGLKILAINVSTQVSTTDTLGFWEYSSPSDGSPSLIDTVIISAGVEARETTITDSDIATSSYIYIDLSSGTGLDRIGGSVVYYIKTGD